MIKTTLCYIKIGDEWLMLRRDKKKNDENALKYIGLGGHFLPGETPEKCMLREVYEESGIVPENHEFRGIVHFSSDLFEDEDMYLFTAESKPCALPECDEGTLCLVPENKVLSLPLWAGDRVFLKLLFENRRFSHLYLRYRGEELVFAKLDGQELKI